MENSSSLSSLQSSSTLLSSSNYYCTNARLSYLNRKKLSFSNRTCITAGSWCKHQWTFIGLYNNEIACTQSGNSSSSCSSSATATAGGVNKKSISSQDIQNAFDSLLNQSNSLTNANAVDSEMLTCTLESFVSCKYSSNNSTTNADIFKGRFSVIIFMLDNVIYIARGQKSYQVYATYAKPENCSKLKTTALFAERLDENDESIVRCLSFGPDQLHHLWFGTIGLLDFIPPKAIREVIRHCSEASDHYVISNHQANLLFDYDPAATLQCIFSDLFTRTPDNSELFIIRFNSFSTSTSNSHHNRSFVKDRELRRMKFLELFGSQLLPPTQQQQHPALNQHFPLHCNLCAYLVAACLTVCDSSSPSIYYTSPPPPANYNIINPIRIPLPPILTQKQQRPTTIFPMHSTYILPMDKENRNRHFTINTSTSVTTTSSAPAATVVVHPAHHHHHHQQHGRQQQQFILPPPIKHRRYEIETMENSSYRFNNNSSHHHPPHQQQQQQHHPTNYHHQHHVRPPPASQYRRLFHPVPILRKNTNFTEIIQIKKRQDEEKRIQNEEEKQRKLDEEERERRRKTVEEDKERLKKLELQKAIEAKIKNNQRKRKEIIEIEPVDDNDVDEIEEYDNECMITGVVFKENGKNSSPNKQKQQVPNNNNNNNKSPAAAVVASKENDHRPNRQQQLNSPRKKPIVVNVSRPSTRQSLKNQSPNKTKGVQNDKEILIVDDKDKKDDDDSEEEEDEEDEEEEDDDDEEEEEPSIIVMTTRNKSKEMSSKSSTFRSSLRHKIPFHGGDVQSRVRRKSGMRSIIQSLNIVNRDWETIANQLKCHGITTQRLMNRFFTPLDEEDMEDALNSLKFLQDLKSCFTRDATIAGMIGKMFVFDPQWINFYKVCVNRHLFNKSMSKKSNWNEIRSLFLEKFPLKKT